MNIVKKCPMCNKYHQFSGINIIAYDKYTNGEGFIQDLFPGYNATEREFIKTGYCPSCQHELFNNAETTNKIKEVF